MFLTKLYVYLSAQRKRDTRVFKRVEERFNSLWREDTKFQKKADDIRVAMSDSVFYYSEILRKYVDNPIGDLFFERPFSQAVVISILKDEEFIGFLVQSRLINRVINLTYDTKGEIKLRLYYAILCYDDYKKQQWSKNKKWCE